ncbi:hypothetical protein [Methanoculleus sp.]|uniref:hypothetical protein n=1 Tax=Methanoculleus sp. TaxID=90427 RepID=UPI0025CBA71D|nr:hypothetical protein [Methanoculleus sp.]
MRFGRKTDGDEAHLSVAGSRTVQMVKLPGAVDRRTFPSGKLAEGPEFEKTIGL